MSKQNKIIAGALVLVMVLGAALVRYGAVASEMLSSPSVYIETVENLNWGGGSDEVLGGLVSIGQRDFPDGVSVAGTEVISSSRGVAASTLSASGAATLSSTLNITGNVSQGEDSTTGYMYFGTTDGCGALTFAASGTWPTLTPTSSAFCN